ncbi:Na+/H+ antiporter subunit E [Clostridia bacterium]|nr:Na+/H+ antiporter subunit E [Clostridia bacterium]
MRDFLNSLISRFGFILLLLAFWLGFSPDITVQTVLIGLFFSAIIKKISDYLFQDIYRINVDYRFILGFFSYFLNLLGNIMISAFSMVQVVFCHQDDPIIFNVHLTTDNPLVVILVANAITLTPGTITLEIGDDQVLSVLSINAGKKGTAIMENDIIAAYEKPFQKLKRKERP